MTATTDRALARLASAQHGIVTRRQVLEVGITADQVATRIRRGSLLRVHPGVYRVGHDAPSDRARYLAAVLACGEGAVLSGLSAAHLLGLTRLPTVGAEVTAMKARRVENVLVHRARTIVPESTERDGIPVTTPAWTLVDVAGRLDDDPLARACHEAFVRDRYVAGKVLAALDRRPHAAGARRLRRIMLGDDPVVLSRLERDFVEALRAAGLELPAANVRVNSHRVDCHWPDRRLIVELDSYRFHGSRQSWVRDHRRDREARQSGHDLIRYTAEDVYELRSGMLAELRSILRRGRRRASDS